MFPCLHNQACVLSALLFYHEKKVSLQSPALVPSPKFSFSPTKCTQTHRLTHSLRTWFTLNLWRRDRIHFHITSILKKTPLYSYVFCMKGRIINSSLKKNKERNETITGLWKVRPWEKNMGFLVQVQRQHQTAQLCYLQNVKKEKQLGKFLNFDHLCHLSVICSK